MRETLGEFLVPLDMAVTEALRVMDKAGEKILFVTADTGVLQGVLTDGDVRRWILANRSLDDPVRHVMNDHPHVLSESASKEDARRLLVEHHLECAPVLDADGRIVSAVWWVDLFEERISTRVSVDLPVVIMAGGEGTRLEPFTRILPKPLVPIGDTPVIELIMARFAEYGCQEFYLSVNYKANLIKAYFADSEAAHTIHYIDESEPLGTAGSLRTLRGMFATSMFVSNCDVLVDADYADILAHHVEQRNEITLVASMKRFTIPYGVCDIGDGGRLLGITEKPEHDHLVSTGLYVLAPAALDVIPAEGRFDFTQLIAAHLERGLPVGVYPVSERSWTDVGQWEALHTTLGRLGVR